MELASFVPSLREVEGLIDYLVANPALFIHSSTVITSTLVLSVFVVRLVAFVSRGRLRERLGALLAIVSPALALLLLYFGIGAMALSTEILLRFHDTIPLTTEVQFRSGIGHLLIGLLGVGALFPWLRRRTTRMWLLSNLAAIAYWAFQVVVLTPPWFSFQGQRRLVLVVVDALLAVSATATLFALVRLARRAHLPPDPLRAAGGRLVHPASAATGSAWSPSGRR